MRKWLIRYLPALLTALVLLAMSPLGTVAQVTVLNFFDQVAGGSRDNVLNLDGTLEFEDKVTVIDHGSKAVGATGYGSVATNLSSIATCAVSLKNAASGATPSLDPYHVTAIYTTGSGTLELLVWKATSSSNPTLAASAVASTVAYACFGSD